MSQTVNEYIKLYDKLIEIINKDGVEFIWNLKKRDWNQFAYNDSYDIIYKNIVIDINPESLNVTIGSLLIGTLTKNQYIDIKKAIRDILQTISDNADKCAKKEFYKL